MGVGLRERTIEYGLSLEANQENCVIKTTKQQVIQ